MESGLPVWQLPVKQSNLTCVDWIHYKAKFHCFIKGSSLCGKYYQNTDCFETDIEGSEIATKPKIACKICRKRWIERFDLLK